MLNTQKNTRYGLETTKVSLRVSDELPNIIPNPGSFIMSARIEYQPKQIIGECVYLYEIDKDKNGYRGAVFQCRCGKTFTALINSVKRGNTNSCGCYQKQRARERFLKHGLSTTRLYVMWTAMKKRCYNTNDKQYADYGGRGIIVCDEWKNDFKKFHTHMMSLPHAMGPEYTIDRIDNDGHYERGNIRFVSIVDNNRNR